MYCVAIIGGGPAGYVAAEKALRAGKTVVLFEKEAVGGTCLNVGCIPTKTLLYSAKLYHNATHTDKYGVKTEGAGFDFAKMQQRKTKVVRKLVAGIRGRLQGCEMVQGLAEVTAWTPESVTIECAGQTYEAENLLVCSGSTNFVPPIPGIADNPRVWSSTDALAATELPASVAIVGGGVIGLEFATLYSELGVPVTVIEALPTILPNIDPEIADLLAAAYRKRGITILTATRVQEIQEGKILTDQGELEADRILVCVGRRPCLDGLETLPLERDRHAIRVNEYMQTNLPNVYAAGDVTGKIMLAHVASRQAEVAIEHMLNAEKAAPMSYKAVPSVVYTNPEIASVGARETDLPQAEVHRLPMTFSGRFVAENEGENGLCKILTENGRICGVHLFGNPCSEFVAAAAVAIEAEMTVEQFSRVIFPHPTVSEILKEATLHNPS